MNPTAPVVASGAIPSLSGNSDLADAFLKLIFERATKAGISAIEVKVQIVYHLIVEILLSDVQLSLVLQLAALAAADIEDRLDEIVGGAA